MLTLTDLAPALNNEAKAVELVEKFRWPDGPVCPHCGHDKVYELKGKAGRVGLRKCADCRKQFTVRVGTIFEDSHIPLGKWLYAIHMMASSKKGISANQLKRELGLGYKAAWFMCHRIRVAMTLPPLSTKLGGASGSYVEVDETYVGGKLSNNTRKQAKGIRGTQGKAIVMTLVDREGEARTFPVPNTRRGTMQTIIRMNVEGSARIVTDSHPFYRGLERKFVAHHVVDHHRKEYVRGIIHTNFAESYHSLLKRGIVGAFHHVSEKHLPKYLREFEFRWNSRTMPDSERTTKAIKMAEGKRLFYRQPVSPKPSSRDV